MSTAVVDPANTTNPEKPDISQKKQELWSTKYIAIGVTACIGGLIFQLITGSLYQWGIINIYVTSYFKTIDPGVTLESNAVAFPIMMFCMGLPMRLGIYLAEITHPMFMLITCQVLLSISVFVSSYMTAMWPFIFFYGILFGILVGLSFMIPIIEVNKYFPGKKNYVNGCILVGTGSGSVVFGMFSYSYLNPLKLKPLLGYYLGTPEVQEIALRVPALLKILALMYLCFGLVGIAMMSPVVIGNRRKQNQILAKEQTQRGEDQRNGIIVPQAVPKPNILNDHEAHSLKQAFCSKICWIQVAIVLLTACGLYLINGNYKTYVKKSINDDYFLTIIGAIGAVANGCSRFIWNIFFLKTGYKTVMLIILAISVTVYSTIRFTVHIPGLFLIEVLMINFCIGGLLVTTPTVAQAIYGQKTGSNIYGFYWEVVALANFIQYLFVSNLSKTIGFDNIIYICLGMAVLAVPIVIITRFQGPWHNETAALEYCVGHELVKSHQHIDQSLQAFHEKHELMELSHKLSELKELKPNKLDPLSQQYILKKQKNHTLHQDHSPQTTQHHSTAIVIKKKQAVPLLPPIEGVKKEVSNKLQETTTQESKQVPK